MDSAIQSPEIKTLGSNSKRNEQQSLTASSAYTLRETLTVHIIHMAPDIYNDERARCLRGAVHAAPHATIY